jgi:oxygen-dependent protoporphyrinogen oxidase
MRGKLLFVTGAAVGYVLGTRAGRKRYEQIKSAATKVWESPGIQKQVNAVEDLVAAKVGDVPGALYEGAKKLVGQIAGRQKGQSSSLVVRPDTSPAVPSKSPAKPAPEGSGDAGA